MKKIFQAFACIAAFALIATYTGCEDDNDGDARTVEDGDYVVMEVVMAKDHAPDGLTFRTTDWNVLVGSGTIVNRQRPSCSGLNVESGNSIQIGDTIEFDVRNAYTTYYPDSKTTPSYINAYRSECTGATEQGPVIIYTNSPCVDEDNVPCDCETGEPL